MARSADFDQLKPILQAHCQRLQYAWANYEKSVKILLDGPHFGVVLMAKSESGDVVGFCAFTYEYCDKQNATYF